MARLVACDFEMPMKLFMMPHTVPNRPTNGAVAPMLASMPVPRVMRRPVAASMRSRREATRSLMPSLSTASAERLSSIIAARTSGARPCRSPNFLAASASEDMRASAVSSLRSRRLAANISSVLASAIVQVTNDANARPIITAFTTMSADRNMPHGERSRGSCAAALVGGEAGSFAGATAGACGSACRGPAAAAAGAGALGGGVCADAGQQTIAASSNAAQACATGPSMILSNLFIQYLAFRF